MTRRSVRVRTARTAVALALCGSTLLAVSGAAPPGAGAERAGDAQILEVLEPARSLPGSTVAGESTRDAENHLTGQGTADGSPAPVPAGAPQRPSAMSIARTWPLLGWALLAGAAALAVTVLTACQFRNGRRRDR